MASCGRPAVFLLLASVLACPASAQSVISTHSGVIYFFEGSVFLGDQRLEQKFGRFPDLGEGSELRTERGRAEVLLTPGVFLRIADNSAVRMKSNQLSDTRVELLQGSAILEYTETRSGTSAKMFFRDWWVQIAGTGVYRIDAAPPQLTVFKGEIVVSKEGEAETTAVRQGQVLPLAPILLTEQAAADSGDPFKYWAMSRSQAIAGDNAIAGEIVDDPSQLATSDLGGLTYFPVTGVPSLGITNPYGLSFWSPYQSRLSSIYFPAYRYGLFYPSWPSGAPFYARPIGIPSRMGAPSRVGGGFHSGVSPLPSAPFGRSPQAPSTGAGTRVSGAHVGGRHR